MYNKKLTLSNGVEIPQLGLGTQFIDDDKVADAVKAAANLGYRHFDTAQAYGNERGVGEGIRTCGIPREELFRTQTPHVYDLKKLLWAHEEAKKKNITNTAASCDLMYKLGEEVYFSRGTEENFKITTVNDLTMFKAMLKTRRDEWIKQYVCQ